MTSFINKYYSLISAVEFVDLSAAGVLTNVMVVSVSIVVFSLVLLFVCVILKWRRDEEVIPAAGQGKKESLLPTHAE